MTALTRSIVVVMALVMTSACSGDPGGLVGPSPAINFTVSPNGTKVTYNTSTDGVVKTGDGNTVTTSNKTAVHTYPYLPGEKKAYEVTFTSANGGSVTKTVEVKPLLVSVGNGVIMKLAPKSGPFGNCPPPAVIAGKIRPVYQITPGGGPVLIYLMKSGTGGTCRTDGQCFGAVLGHVVSSGQEITASWPVEVGPQYCVHVVNMSDTEQSILGTIYYEMPYQP